MQAIGRLLAVMVTVVGTVCWVAGCGAKKSEPEAVPETRDTLLVTHDTLSEIHNTLTDSRDGKTYKTVTIGKQTWMGKNLNYATSRGSWCYDNDTSHCDTYGRLYDWAAAMNIRSDFNNNLWRGNDVKHQGVCPEGWHLPSRGEWDELAEFVGGTKAYSRESSDYHDWYDAGKYLKSQTGWNSYSGVENLDTHGFSALPGASRVYSVGSFDNAGGYGAWWAATEYSDGGAYGRGMDDGNDNLDESDYDKEDGFSVRCVGDRSAISASSQKNVGDDKAKIEMVFVKGGTFTMGCTPEQGEGCDDDESPTHTVTLSDYYMGKYEVTQKQWREVMGSLPSSVSSSYGYGDNYPVYYVSWNDIAGANGFIAKLNRQTGKRYRLPTEAAWEYAARGGQNSQGYKYSGSNTIGDVAWYSSNSGSTTHIVGGKYPNELGIYDMSGNVYEWVSDWYGSYSSTAQTNPVGPSTGSSRVDRGGCWYCGARYCRVSVRFSSYPDRGSCDLGFRLALSP